MHILFQRLYARVKATEEASNQAACLLKSKANSFVLQLQPFQDFLGGAFAIHISNVFSGAGIWGV